MKLFGKILLLSFLVVAILNGMFFFDSGRRIILNLISSLLRVQNIELVVDGLDGKITEARKIYFRSPRGTELTFSNIRLCRKRLFDKPSIQIETFVFKGSDGENNSNEELKNLIPLTRKLRFFLKKLSLKKGFLHVDSQTRLLSDLNYQSRENEDTLSVKIDEKKSINVALKWKGEECLEGDIAFGDIFNFSGNMRILYPERSETKYNFTAQNNQIKIAADGRYENFMLCIKIDTVSLKYKNVVYSGFGDLYPTRRAAILKAKIIPEQLPNFNAIPSAIAENFKNVHGYLDVACYFNEKFKCSADVVFKRSETVVGNLRCIHENHRTKIAGDVGWIKIFGFNLSRLTGEIDEKMRSKLNLSGKDFELVSQIKFNDQILVEKLELKSPKGFLKSSGPFFMTGDFAFDFDFNQLDFWNRIIPISGNGSGSFLRKKGVVSGHGNFEKFSFKNHKFYGLELFGDGKNYQITSKNAKIFDSRLENLELKIAGKLFNLSGKANDRGRLKAFGEVSESFKKISFKSGEIAFPRHKIRLETCVLDMSSGDYKIYCSLLDKRKSGGAQINFNLREITCDFKSFPVGKFMELFNRR
ncbi:MAG: hypothetical protein LBO02_01330, partial [Holosporaceae bacterium]|nr:hypothetical protein [Holosporaceae bacterium]